MTDTLKHTPTPWRYDPLYKNSALVVADQDNEVFPYQDMCIECHSANGGPEQNKSNAEFIVRAVNNHQALLDACRILVHEARGVLYMGEAELRHLVGNTNFTCLENRVKEAEVVIKEAEKP